MNFFGKLQSMGGNYVSRLGGFGDDPGELLTKTELDNLSDAEFDAYKKQKEAAKTAGMRELASRLSDAFAGRDIVGRAQERKTINIQRENQLKAEKRRKELEQIFQTNKLSDFGTNREYYKTIGSELMNKGYLDQGLKFAELGRPQTPEDLRSDILKQQGVEAKVWNPVKKGLTNFQQLLDAAESDTGTGSYALMIKFIKQLDDSVVREGEVRTFGNFQGVYANLKNELEKAKGEGFSAQTRANIVNLGRKSAEALWNDWTQYKDTKNQSYNILGITPELVFSGLDYDIDSLGFGTTTTPEDIENIKYKIKK
jgi:hypothetical protein